jgi:hypothetical protein
VFLGADDVLLYVGKAGDLRSRLRQHAAVEPSRSHLHRRYELVRSVRWQQTRSEEEASWHEADWIFGLAPPFNAETGPQSPGHLEARSRRCFISVRDDGAAVRRFALVEEPITGGDSTTYGCFPHLAKGLAYRAGVVCSDGYVAFLRLLWAASATGTHMPAGITRSAPDQFDVVVAPARVRPLHDLLSGVSARLLVDLAEASSDRPEFMQPALARDRVAAAAFFAVGPKAVRARRRRHGVRSPTISFDDYRELVREEARDAFGPSLRV